jgi:hypothetical protein
MPNPYGNLAGFTDPEDPNWRQNALARVRARQKKTHRNKERTNGMYLFYDEGMRALLDEAARRRGISRVGYGRRAVAAFIAHDLNLPIEEVLQYTAKPAPYEGTPGGIVKKINDDGEGYGPWPIAALE